MSAETLTLTVGGSALTVPVRRHPRARTVRLHLRPNGQPLLTAPSNLDPARICHIAQSFQPWLEEKIGERAHYSCLPTEIELPMTARKLVVKMAGDTRKGLAAACETRLLFEHGHRRFIFTLEKNSLRIYGPEADPPILAEGLRSFLRGMATDIVPPLVLRLARAGGFEIPAIAVRDQRKRWGSCSRSDSGKGKLNLNWRMLFLEPELASHLVWHELAHLRHMNHSDSFYKELERWSPNCRAKERDLNRAWLDLPKWTLPPAPKSR